MDVRQQYQDMRMTIESPSPCNVDRAIAVIVVDENHVFRRGLVSVLKDYPDFVVVGDVPNAKEATARTTVRRPDIVIFGSAGPDANGIQSIWELRQMFPRAKVFVLTASCNQDYILKAMEAGAKGYMHKTAGVSELVESLRLIARGDAVVYPSRVMSPLIAAEATREKRGAFNGLSPREQEVLTLVAQGSSNKEIAARCYVSEATVKAHVRRIREKLCVKNRAQAVGLAVTRGLLNTDASLNIPLASCYPGAPFP
ncbi:MAG: response regulator transcription factor [Chloroflexi bacterium]|nr:response regulator transcription factor [Chloroflexota bacterium]